MDSISMLSTALTTYPQNGVHQQELYFPPQWQNHPSDFAFDDYSMDLSLLQNDLAIDLASTNTPSRSSSESSPCSSEMHSSSSSSDCARKQDRRRAQNRTAQRAYRERKEKLLHELELQVKTWQERHQSLRDSYVDQAHEVQQLKEHVQSLQVQLLTIQATEPFNDQTFCDFDLWPHELAWKTV